MDRFRISKPLSRYRGTGADLPFGDPVRAHHGVAMEGYFWRITDPSTGRVVIALCGANQGPQGSWSTLGLAAWPFGFIQTAARDGAWTDSSKLGVRGGMSPGTDFAPSTAAFAGDTHHLRVDLSTDARLDAHFDQLAPWPHRALGGSSVFQMVPNLNQYWHPWLLGGTASGTAILGDTTWEFHNAHVYAEKNWGREGFPDSWWWGQAQGFEAPDACVAFAGGVVTMGRAQIEVTALVVRLPDARVIRLGNPFVTPVRAHTSDEYWQLVGHGYGWRIEIDAHASLDQAFVLPVPLPSEHRNVPGDIEHLAGNLTVRVHRFGRHVWTGHTRLAALEHGGLDRARAELRRRGLDDSLESAPPCDECD